MIISTYQVWRGSVSLLTAVSAMVSAPAFAAWEPGRTVEFIVPAGTGGGADQMARFIQGMVAKHKLMKQSMVVVNKGGGAGADGFLDVKEAKGNPQLIITLSNLFTTPLATHTPFNWRDLTPADDGARRIVLWVNAETPYKTAKQYVEAAKKAGPGKFKMGVRGEAGGSDHHGFN
jgi:tripartite-type tricarboxylate transporter receptor subunit TctC